MGNGRISSRNVDSILLGRIKIPRGLESFLTLVVLFLRPLQDGDR